MKNATVVISILFFCTLAAIAQAPQTIGAWATYPSTSPSGDRIVLLQTNVLSGDGGAQGQPGTLKLDAICKNGKLYRLALETDFAVSSEATNFSGAVPTTSVSFQRDGSAPETQHWAVLDRGRTVSPYGELTQGKKNRILIQRIAGSNEVVFGFHADNKGVIQARFHTDGISRSLTSVGCTY